MRVRSTALFLALQLGATPAVLLAQGDGGFQRWPSRDRPAPAAPAGGDQGARPRERQPRDRPAEPTGRPTPPPQAGRSSSDDNGDRQARDRDRDRGGRVAVPRPEPPRVANRPTSRAYVVRPPVYRYIPRFNRPYVYGSFGPGYFYYGAFGWYPRATFLSDRGVYGRGYGYDTGEVRLRVEPRWAEVYVDGYYAGTVDDFDGTFQSLRLESGPYHLEIVAPGYEPLELDLRIPPGQKITYRGGLRPTF